MAVENRYKEKDEALFAEVQKLKEGISENYNRVYELSEKYIYKIINDIVKNHHTTEDLMQETYLQIYNKIDTLQEAKAFYVWAGRIATNLTLRHVQKYRKEVLATEDSEGNTDFVFEYASEDNESFIPENVLMDKEKQRLIAEIIDNLSVEQKLSVQYFYYEEMSVRDIASAMGCSEGTVKSRLNYARKSIKDAVIDLNVKQGTKLYSLGAFPLLWLVFRENVEALVTAGGTAAAVGSAGFIGGSAGTAGTVGGAAESAGVVGGSAGTTGSMAVAAGSEATVAGSVAGVGSTAAATGSAVTSAGSAAAATAAKAAGGIGAKLFGTVVGKAVIGVTAAAVVVGGGATVYNNVNKPKPEPDTFVEESVPVSAPVETPSVEKEPEKQPQKVEEPNTFVKTETISFTPQVSEALMELYTEHNVPKEEWEYDVIAWTLTGEVEMENGSTGEVLTHSYELGSAQVQENPELFWAESVNKFLFHYAANDFSYYCDMTHELEVDGVTYYFDTTEVNAGGELEEQVESAIIITYEGTYSTDGEGGTSSSATVSQPAESVAEETGEGMISIRFHARPKQQDIWEGYNEEIYIRLKNSEGDITVKETRSTSESVMASLNAVIKEKISLEDAKLFLEEHQAAAMEASANGRGYRVDARSVFGETLEFEYNGERISFKIEEAEAAVNNMGYRVATTGDAKFYTDGYIGMLGGEETYIYAAGVTYELTGTYSADGEGTPSSAETTEPVEVVAGESGTGELYIHFKGDPQQQDLWAGCDEEIDIKLYNEDGESLGNGGRWRASNTAMTGFTAPILEQFTLTDAKGIFEEHAEAWIAAAEAGTPYEITSVPDIGILTFEYDDKQYTFEINSVVTEIIVFSFPVDFYDADQFYTEGFERAGAHWYAGGVTYKLEGSYSTDG